MKSTRSTIATIDHINTKNDDAEDIEAGAEHTIILVGMTSEEPVGAVAQIAGTDGIATLRAHPQTEGASIADPEVLTHIDESMDLIVRSVPLAIRGDRYLERLKEEKTSSAGR